MVRKSMEDYEYDLPGEPLHGSSESLGECFFTHPVEEPHDLYPFDPERDFKFRSFTPWIVGCIVMLVCGGFFEFGILGKDGKTGPICHSVLSDKLCSVLAGPAPPIKSKK